MKFITIIFLTFNLFFSSCNPSASPEKKTVQENTVTDPVSQTDTSEELNADLDEKRKTEKETQRYFHPQKSYCGGALYGIYQDKVLIRIESTFGGEYGYSSKDVDFEKDKIVKITYRENYAEYDKYREKYPDLESIEPEKLTYSDTVYVLEFGKVTSFKKYAGKKLISTQINKELLNNLVNCVETMKRELNREKVLVKN